MRPGNLLRTTGNVALERRAAAALRALLLSAVVTGGGCGSVASSTSDGIDAGAASNASMVLGGCSVVGGGIPLPNDSPNATRLTDPVIAPATRGKALAGSIRMVDAQADATALLVQVRGASDHLVCTISASERANNRIDLSRLTVMSASPAGTQVVYFAVQDAMGNLGGSVMGIISFASTPTPIALCGDSAGPIQILGQQAAVSTTQLIAFNGAMTDYVTSTKQQLAIVAQGRIYLDMGACTHLQVGGDRTGTKTVGWDDLLLVEYRSVPSAAVSQAWYYTTPGAAGAVTVRGSQPVTRGEDATVPGRALVPPVGNDAPFGYAGRAIDLMTRVPAGSRVFELTLTALDYFSAGSTTEVWLFAL